MFTACGGDGPGAQPSKPTSGSESGDGGGDDIELDEDEYLKFLNVDLDLNHSVKTSASS